MPTDYKPGPYHEAGLMLRELRGDRSLRALRYDMVQAFHDDAPSHTTIAKWEQGWGITRDSLAIYVEIEGLGETDADQLYAAAGMLYCWAPYCEADALQDG
jgi:hypothetical protein